jgi:FtsH ternary system domain X3
MHVRVRLRINKLTGEVEEFQVEDEGTMRLPESDHNRQHDRIAADLGNVIERHAHVVEVLPGVVNAPAVYEPEITPEIQSEDRHAVDDRQKDS